MKSRWLICSVILAPLAVQHYGARRVPPADLANSGRLESVLRAGRLYLSLVDCIALALENNLDTAIERYGPRIADAQVLPARAGGFAQRVSTSVTAGPTSAQLGGVARSGNTAISQSGPPVPSFDPALAGSASRAYQAAPRSSAFVTGTTARIQRKDLGLNNATPIARSNRELAGLTFKLQVVTTVAAVSDLCGDPVTFARRRGGC